MANGFDVREFPKATFECLRYQIGKYSTEMIQVSVHKRVPERIFRLVAWGKNTEAAHDMLRRIKEGK